MTDRRSSRPSGLRLLVVLAGLTAGCVRGPTVALDPSLPDGAAIEVDDVRGLLDRLTGSGDPSARGVALAWSTRLAEGTRLNRYALQGTYDPESFVQREVVRVLLERLDEPAAGQMLADYLARPQGDATVRGLAAAALVRAERPEAASRVRGAWSGKPPYRALPLAVGAFASGEAEAEVAILRGLSDGNAPDDAELFAVIGTLGPPDWALAASVGQALAEDTLARKLAFCRALLGDEVGRADVRRAVRSTEPGVAGDILDLVRALPTEALRRTWARELKRAKVPGVRAAGALLAAPSPERVRRALRSEDPDVLATALALAHLVDDDDLEAALPTAIDSSDRGLQRTAFELVGARGLQGLRGAVAVHLGAPQRDVAAAAAGAITALTPTDSP